MSVAAPDDQSFVMSDPSAPAVDSNAAPSSSASPPASPPASSTANSASASASSSSASSSSSSSSSAPHSNVNPNFSFAARPTCPTILIPFEGQLYALPIYQFDIKCEFHLSTAFVRIVGTWKNIANYKSDCIFVLPVNGTVTNCTIEINERVVETSIIPMKEAQQLQKQDPVRPPPPQPAHDPNDPNSPAPAPLPLGVLPPMSYEEYIPNLFRLPITNVNSADMIRVNVSYVEPLAFINNSYHFTLPLQFGSNLIPHRAKLSDIMRIKVMINALNDDTQYHSTSHDLLLKKLEHGRVELDVLPISAMMKKKSSIVGPNDVQVETNSAADNNDASAASAASAQPQPESSIDFQLSYSMSSSEIVSSCIKQVTHPASSSQEEEGSFLLHVTPPAATSALAKSSQYSRQLIFLLDRSGSMGGEPYVEASRALTVALSNLKPVDQFTIVAFDHRQEWFNQNLVNVTPGNVAAAATWIRGISPEKGGTDISTPLQWALTKLSGPGKRVEDGQGAEIGDKVYGRLPFVVLLTDGCVANEREICHIAANSVANTRILTFGIGSLANWFFLKQLAQIGRGFSDVVVYREKIYSQILQLLNAAAVPLLTNVTLTPPSNNQNHIDVDGSGITSPTSSSISSSSPPASVFFYPNPLPDLCLSAPLTISGEYRGSLNGSFTLSGLKSDGSIFSFPIVIRSNANVPVKRVLIQQQIDLLTAKAWLEQSREVENQVVELSCDEGMPSAYTTMVAYETTKTKKKEMEKKKGDELGGMEDEGKTDEGIEEKTNGEKKSLLAKSGIQPKWYKNPKTITALSIGGSAMVIGAAAFSFGDVAGTLGNIPGLGDVLGSFDAGCCDVCGECGDCDCGECLAC